MVYEEQDRVGNAVPVVKSHGNHDKLVLETGEDVHKGNDKEYHPTDEETCKYRKIMSYMPKSELKGILNNKPKPYRFTAGSDNKTSAVKL